MPEAHDPLQPVDPVAAKRSLRRELLTARRAPDARRPDGAALARRVLELPELEGARRVALFCSSADEPDTGPLIDALAERGVAVLLPVLLGDDDLDWAAWAGPDRLTTGRRGTRHPDTTPEGPEAVGRVDVVVVPGLAVGPDGMRLGRGGGSYDRALARVPGTVPVVVLLHPGELDQPVVGEPHDLPVDVAVTGDEVRRWHELGRTGPGR